MCIRWMTPRRSCVKLSSAYWNISHSAGGSLAAGFGSSVWVELQSCCLWLSIDRSGFSSYYSWLLHAPAQTPSGRFLTAISEACFHSMDTINCSWENKYDNVSMDLMQNWFKWNFKWMLKTYFGFLSLQSLQMLPQQRKAIAKFKEPAHALAFQQKFHR